MAHHPPTGDDSSLQEPDGRPRAEGEDPFARAFGLERSPFSVALRTEFLFLSKVHREVLASLILGVERERSVLCLVGEVGTGKSLLLAALRERLESTRTFIALRHLPSTPNELLRMMMKELAADDRKMTRVDRLERLTYILEEDLRTRATCPVLVVDEAQRLPLRLFEEIRLLSNLERNGSRLLQVVVAGQPELDKKLVQYNLRQFTQRIALRARLVPLTRAESFELIDHRLRRAGRCEGDPPLFTNEALEAIYEASRGVPRLILALCDQSLLAAYAAYSEQVDQDLVRSAIELLEIVPPEQLEAETDTVSWVGGESPPSEEGASLRLVQGQGAGTEDPPDSGGGTKRAAPSEPEGEPVSHSPSSSALKTASLSREGLFLKVHARLRGVELTNEVAQELASGANTDYDELNGIIDRLVEMADQSGAPLTADVVREAIGPGSAPEEESDSRSAEDAPPQSEAYQSRTAVPISSGESS